MSLHREKQLSSEMKFDGRLIKVTFDVADVMVKKPGVKLCIIQERVLLSLLMTKVAL